MNGGQFFGGLTLTTGALLTGTGTLAPGVTNTSGVIFPGGANSFGTLKTSTFTQGATGTLNIDVGPPGSGQFDVINNGNGAAALNGALAVTRPGASMANQTFPIITSGSRTGTFSTITGLAPDLSAAYGTGLSLVGPTVAPPPAPAKPVITLPSNKKCKKSVKVKITPPAGTTIKTSSVKAGKKKVKTKASNGVVTAKIKLKKKTKVSVTATTSAGGTLSASKTYKRCG